MSQYYTVKRRSVFDPKSTQPFRVSRSKIDLFVSCPRCFYLDRRLGVERPPGYPFNLNSAVDALLKKEFDAHRAKGQPHPLMKAYGLDAVPFKHEKMDEWRDSLKRGIQFLHIPTNLFVTGGVDDVWVNPRRELIIVDYKATSKSGEITLDAQWQDGYKRQMEVYQWLFRQNGFTVSNIGYFVYCNGNRDKEAFDGRLEFDVKLIAYEGSDDWVEPTIRDIHACLMGSVLPKNNPDCDFCNYRKAGMEAIQPFLQ
ncbi:PD-(D/E)XK nuclease family protein [Candidatus Uhrbacteria bacterium]|nr:PD-(D/E)XK nuclease family protein [Candidatus Uhrbacteria bacterium]